MTTATVLPSTCANCGARLDGAFCSHCGQKATPLNPSVGEFLHDLFHEIAHVDGKTVQSVRLLLTRPGFLSREHFEGRRVRYVSPIRLYLVLSILYFGLAALAPASAVRVTVTPGKNERAVDLEPRQRELQKAVNEVFTHWAPRAMFVLVPVFAGLIGLVARRSGRNYPQHLYFALHVHAAWFFAGAVVAGARILAIPYVSSALAGAAGVYAILYFVLAFRYAYHATVLRAIVSSAAVGAVYSVVVGATLFAFAFPAIQSAMRG